MKRESKHNLGIALGMLVSFVLWTIALRFVDVGAIGPRESAVGFSTMNRLVHEFTGVHMSLYVITDWLGLVPIAFAMGFAVLGLVQWIRRKRIWKVDSSILVLGGFYLLVIAVYILFETVVVNYRPVLINDFLEVSYPSSTTMLVLCVMPTAVMQCNSRIKNRIVRYGVACALTIFILFMVVGRLVAGVHWFSDIVGGVLLSTGLVYMYRTVCSLIDAI